MRFYSTILIAVFVLISTKPVSKDDLFIEEDYYCIPSESINAPYPDSSLYYSHPFDIDGFQYALGLRESGNNYDTVNTIGYLGRYQFGYMALEDVGISRNQRGEFLSCPDIQDKAFMSLIKINKYRLRNYIKYFNGKKWKYTDSNGNTRHLVLTESGMVAAAHLIGANDLKKYLNGKPGRTEDKYGTRIEEYLVKFSFYDLSSIPAAQYATVKD